MPPHQHSQPLNGTLFWSQRDHDQSESRIAPAVNQPTAITFDVSPKTQLLRPVTPSTGSHTVPPVLWSTSASSSSFPFLHQSLHQPASTDTSNPESTSINHRSRLHHTQAVGSSVLPEEALGSQNTITVRSKRRIALSCAECAKRKQKCNRETPCQHCVSRRVPELCIPYSRTGPPPAKGVRLPPLQKQKLAKAVTSPPTSRPASALPTLSVRVARIENMLNAVINRVDGLEGGRALSEWRINHPPAFSPAPSIVSDDDIEIDASQPQASESAHEEPIETCSEGEVAPVMKLDIVSGLRNPLPQSMIPSEESYQRGLDTRGTAADQLRQLFRDSNVQVDKLQNLMNKLPRKDLASRLVQSFFQKFNYLRYPIDEAAFAATFEMVYARNIIDPPAVLALPLIFIVLAIAARIPSEEQDDKRAFSVDMYWNSKSAVIIASTVKTEHLQLVETHILTGLYLILMHERRLAEGWTEFRAALSIGQAIGLQRDGMKLGLEPYATEYRRRLWSYLLHADCSYSCLLGRPTAVDLKYADTQPPRNISLDELRTDSSLTSYPDKHPTFGTYLRLRYRLATIVSKISQMFQRLDRVIPYRDVTAIEADFTDLIDSLPPTFRFVDPDRSKDNVLWFLQVHRYYIQTEIQHFRIILHRPWLLRRLRSNRYARSRGVCYEAAISDDKIRRNFKRDCPNFVETLFGGSFRSFNAAMIAGISLIVDPKSVQAPEMKLIIETFMQQHPFDPSADDFTQQEAVIVDTLYRRGLEVQNRQSRRPSAPIQDLLIDDDRVPVRQPSSNIVDIFTSRGRTMSTPVPKLFSQPGREDVATSTSGSPEEDHAQIMLDNWLLSNSLGQSAINPLSSTGPSNAVQISNQAVNSQFAQAEPIFNNPWASTAFPSGLNLATNVFPQFQVNPDHIVAGGGATQTYWDNLIDGIITSSQYESGPMDGLCEER